MNKLMRSIFVFSILGVSVLLLLSGVPRFMAELMLVPGNAVTERLSFGKPVTADELLLLEQSRLDALSFVEKPSFYSDLAQVYYEQAVLATSADEQKELLAKVIEQSEKSLNLKPINSYDWMRISSAYHILHPEGHPRAVEAWATSVKTARFEDRLILPRIHVGVLMFAHLDTEHRQILKEQIDLAYRWDRDLLKKYAVDNNFLAWVSLLSAENMEMYQFFQDQPQAIKQ